MGIAGITLFGIGISNGEKIKIVAGICITIFSIIIGSICRKENNRND